MADLSAYRFTSTHEWVRQDDGTATVGITEFAASQLGDVIFVELPSVGTELKAGGKLGSVESVKAASDLYSPVSGTVKEVNTALSDKPEIVNSDPYGDGWLVKVEGGSAGGTDLIDEAAYTKLTAG